MKIIARNKKARHDYEIEKTFEAGVVLTGPEVKSLRQGKIGFADSFARVRKGEIFLHHLNIPQHTHSSFFNHDPVRIRKLLMHKQEIRKLQKKIDQDGYTIVPLDIYFNDRGLVKIRIALVKGKRTPDKKQYLKTQQLEREAKRAVKNFNNSQY